MMKTLFDPPISREPPTTVALTEPIIPSDGGHVCAVCGSPAPFGFGVSLRNDRKGRWACREHRTEVETRKEPRP